MTSHSLDASPAMTGDEIVALTKAHTLFEWPAACGDMAAASEGGCREVGRKSRRGCSESRSPEVSMHSCSGADLAGLDSPRSMRHGGSSTDSLAAPYCQVCCAKACGWPACMCSHSLPAYARGRPFCNTLCGARR